MTTATTFSTLGATTRRRLARLATPEGWRSARALAGFPKAADVLDAASAPNPPAQRRPVLSALLCLAATDRLAAEVFLAAVVPALRSVAAELLRWAPGGRDEADALVALGAWEAICTLGGTANAWPDRAVVCRARETARARLRAEVLRRSREVPTDEMARHAVAAPEHGLGTLLAADLLARAVATGRLDRTAAALVWAARVEGRTTAELAGLSSRSPGAVAMERLRAERALRAAVA
jgi:hypothetical protein